MVPPGLISKYLEYKKDTDSIAAYLASTAKHFGYKQDEKLNTAKSTPKPAPKSDQPSGSKRLKGKARKQAKVAAAAAAKRPQAAKDDSTPEAAHPTYLIRIKDFVSLAQYIADHIGDRPIPGVFDETIGRVIDLRATFGDELREHGFKTSEKADVSHGYFTEVLLRVREILAPCKEETEMTNGITNTFGALNVEEPSLAFLAAPDVQRPGPAAGDTAIYKTEQQRGLQETLMDYTMLMNDLRPIRSRIKWIWSNQADGHFDIAAAAVTTDTAIGLARTIIQEVEPAMQAEDGGMFAVANEFFKNRCISEEKLSKETSGMMNLHYDVANETYMNAFKFLESFVTIMRPNRLTIIREGVYGYYSASSDRSKQSDREKYTDDKILLFEFFTELTTADRVIPKYPVHDEFMRGMAELCQTKKVPFYAVFAAQIFLDIHHIQRERVSSGFHQFMREVTDMKEGIEAHFSFLEKYKVTSWDVHEDALTQRMNEFKRMLSDPVYEAKVQDIRSTSSSVPERMKPHRILQHSPVITGLLLSSFRYNMYFSGITIANCAGSITYAAHLYNALLKEGMCSRWADMKLCEVILGGPGAFFVGDKAPQDSAGYNSKFFLQMGASASAFAAPQGRPRRTSVMPTSRAGPRTMPSDGAPISAMFFNRFINNMSSEWTAESIAKIVDSTAYQSADNDTGSFRMKRLGIAEVQEKRRAALKQRKAADKTRLVPEDLIKRLLFSLNAEAIETRFPFLAFHRCCWKLLDMVHTAAHDTLCQMYTSSYISDETHLPWMVGYILLGFLDAGRMKSIQLLKDTKVAVDMFFSEGNGTLMMNAMGMSLEEFVKEEGEKEEGD